MTMKRMLIDASHPEETRVVIVNGNRLEDFDVEVESRKQLKGNIYLAKVTRVEPSLQAAFVDYGGNRHGFLAFSEIHPDYYQIPVEDREALMAEEAKETAEDNDDDTPLSEGPVETVGGDDTDEVVARRPYKMRRNYRIQEVVKRGQILLIQVVKEERGGKGAALTTYLSLAGRYCVLMPNTARGGGISRKISNGVDRKRLKVIINDLGIPDGIAVIVRTAGAKRSKAEIKRDYEYLLRLWTQIRETTLESIAPCGVHEEGNLIKRSIRDLYSKEIEEVVVAGDEGYRMAKDFMKLLIPSHAKRVQPFKDEGMSLTQHYQLESQLSVIHSPEVHMKSGGYIVINPTEALVSIDVNSGKATKERNIEETALKTNLEAADEIARQLKLRDLAGLIVIDFIDMEVNRNQTRVERQLKDAMRNDRARIQIGRISPFGLLELSRQRLRPSLLETSSEPCPHCAGTGVRRSTDSTALHILRMIEEECTRRKADDLTLFVPTAVALYLLNFKRPALTDIEARYGTSIVVENDDSLIPPDCRIERKGDVVNLEQPKPKAVHTNQPDRSQSSDDDDDEFAGDGGKRRKRRRGRRRKRSDNDNMDSTEDNAQQISGETPETPPESTEENEESQNKRRRRGRRGGRNRGRKPEDMAAETNNDGENVVADAVQNTTEVEPTRQTAPSDGTADPVTGADPTGEAEEKPKRRRRRRKPSDENSNGGNVQVIPITTSDATTTPDAIEPTGEPAGEDDAASATDGTRPAVSPDRSDATEPETKKPARKPRRKPAAKTAKADTVVETPDNPVVDDAPAKPKRRRRAKAIVEDLGGAAASPSEAVATVAEATDPSSPPPAAEPVRRKPAAARTAETEPVTPAVAEQAETDKSPATGETAPVLVAVEQAKSATEPAVEEKPAKRGWWRR